MKLVLTSLALVVTAIALTGCGGSLSFRRISDQQLQQLIQQQQEG